MATQTWNYETSDMAELRKVLNKAGHSDLAVHTFRACLNSLEEAGFIIIKNDPAESSERMSLYNQYIHDQKKIDWSQNDYIIWPDDSVASVRDLRYYSWKSDDFIVVDHRQHDLSDYC